MEKDKFVINATAKSNGYKPAIIDINTHELLTQMKDMTGVSITKLIEASVKFAFERLEVKED